MSEIQTSKSPKNLNLSLDLRWVVVALFVIIIGMLIVWMPWSSEPTANDRSIDVVGEAVVKSEPDEYVFYPSYDFVNANKDAALADMSKKAEEVTAKLKELGIADNQIKTNSDGYDKFYIAPTEDGKTTYSLRLEVRANDKDKAQQVQNYLVTTAPTGQVSPVAGFSESKQKELEAEARDTATKDARAKADQSAKNLGFSIGKVKSVTDGSGFGGVMPMYARDAVMSSEGGMSVGAQSLQIQAGENEVRYTVSVSYYLK